MRASNTRVILSGGICHCLLPQCEAMCACCSSFLNATLSCKFIWKQSFYTGFWICIRYPYDCRCNKKNEVIFLQYKNYNNIISPFSLEILWQWMEYSNRRYLWVAYNFVILSSHMIEVLFIPQSYPFCVLTTCSD